MADVYDLFLPETLDTALQRIFDDLPDPPNGGTWDDREGSVIMTLLAPLAEEKVRMLSMAREAVSNSFLLWANDRSLDAKAAELGIERLGATKAEVTVTFEGEDDTVIPAGTQVASPGDDITGDIGAVFSTISEATISGGAVDVLCEAVEEGSDSNVAAGTIIELVSPLVGIDSVSNQYAAQGGVDEEDDESLRTRALTRAQLPPSGGNVGYYVNLGLEEPTVATVSVTDQWNDVGIDQAARDVAGSGLMVLSGENAPWVDPSVVDRVQTDIDPSVECIAHFEGTETWTITSGTSVSAEQVFTSALEGEAAWRIHPLTSASTTITRVESTGRDLSRFANSGDEIWLEYKADSAEANISSLSITFSDYDEDNVCSVSASAGQLPYPSGRIVLDVADLTASTGTVAGALASCARVAITLAASGSGDSDVTVDALRLCKADGGLGLGLATMGMQMTVRSAFATYIDVDAAVTLGSGVSVDSVRDDIESALAATIAGVETGGVLRLSTIQNAIYQSGPVVDYSSVQIGRSGGSTSAANITLASGEQTVLGTLTLSVT